MKNLGCDLGRMLLSVIRNVLKLVSIVVGGSVILKVGVVVIVLIRIISFSNLFQVVWYSGVDCDNLFCNGLIDGSVVMNSEMIRVSVIGMNSVVLVFVNWLGRLFGF